LAPDAVVFYTEDGLALWPCVDARNEQNLEWRRIGWRFAQKQWQKGLTLGHSASNDIVLGVALLPAHSARLTLRDSRQLHIESWEHLQNIPLHRRLVCIEALDKPQTTAATTSSQDRITAIDGKSSKLGKSGDLQHKAADGASKLEPQEHRCTERCLAKAVVISPGQGFRIYACNHPERAVSFEWSVSAQELGMYDLRLSPLDGEGLSVRSLPTNVENSGSNVRYAIGKSLMYFTTLIPDNVRTLDLDERVNELVLRKVLLYRPPELLREELTRRHRSVLDLNQIAQSEPLPSLAPYLSILYGDRYLRNRVWMANEALARRYRLQARELFRIDFGGDVQRGELRGLGVGAATVRSPRRNLKDFSQIERRSEIDLRLRTVLTAHQSGRPYLLRLDGEHQPLYDSVYFVGDEALEIASAAIMPEHTRDRNWSAASAAEHTRSLLWANEQMWRSPHALAYGGQPAPSPSPSSEKREPESFIYQIPTRWWLRQKALQRSSSYWPVADVADRLGTPLTRDKLIDTLKQLNPKQWQQRKHCGSESLYANRRWKHGSKCWGAADVFNAGSQILVPCSDLLKTRLREQHCRTGAATPMLDPEGRVVRQALSSIQDMYGVVIMPYPTAQSTQTSTPSDTNRTAQKSNKKKNAQPPDSAIKSDTAAISDTGSTVRSSTSEGKVYGIRRLSGSYPILLDGQPMADGITYALQSGTIIKVGNLNLRYYQPDGVLAQARFHQENITPYYPEGPVFAHIIAGSTGGPFRNSPKQLQEQLPQLPSKITSSEQLSTHDTHTPSHPKHGEQTQVTATPTLRKIATSLQPDLQRIAFTIANKHLNRLDSPEFQEQFRRRYLANPHKPHAGAVALIDRTDGRLLAAVSLPAFNPNPPIEQNPAETHQRIHRYLQGQIVDIYGITDSLLAYDLNRLPPILKRSHSPQERPSHIPHFLEADLWDQRESEQSLRGDQRSGWLLERVLSSAQTPGSTIKIATAIAYANYLRNQNKPILFPAHNCAGGLMFMRQRTHSKTKQVSWRPSTIRFRCNKREGHGSLSFKEALAVSCNVYFAKLALEMAGVPPDILRKGKVQWLSGRHVTGRYQFLQIESDTISKAIQNQPRHRTLFRTASKLGFSMRYQYRKAPNQYGRYTDTFWEPGLSKWTQPAPTLPIKARELAEIQLIRKRQQQELSHGSFEAGRFFGYSSAYPAWQQWSIGATDPRYGYRSSVQRSFGSLDSSTRAMAYVGFGQNLIINPLRLAFLSGVIANGGWMPSPRFWIGYWQDHQPPTKPMIPRLPAKHILNAADAELIREAMAAVTNTGTATHPFRELNLKCLNQYGLQVIGKTGTAENLNPQQRYTYRQLALSTANREQRTAKRKQANKSLCFARRSWNYFYPEENIADSLFTAAIVPISSSTKTTLPQTTGWDIRNLALSVVIKNGNRPEGPECKSERSEAKYLAHDIILAIVQHSGICSQYTDKSMPQISPPKPKRIPKKAKGKR
jgi:cell division protein FtsI/penicillin-binding protein 2